MTLSKNRMSSCPLVPSNNCQSPETAGFPSTTQNTNMQAVRSLMTIKKELMLCHLLFLQKLAEWVAVKSDSIQPELRQEVTRMVEIAGDELQDLGATVNLIDVGSEQVLS